MFKIAVVHNDAQLDEHEIEETTDEFVYIHKDNPYVRITDIDGNIYFYWNVQSINIEKSE